MDSLRLSVLCTLLASAFLGWAMLAPPPSVASTDAFVYGTLVDVEAGHLYIDDEVVHFDAETPVERGEVPLSIDDLRIGQTLLVETTSFDDALHAERIEQWPLLLGDVTRSLARGLRVMHQKVVVDDETITEMGASALVPGRPIAVYGTRDDRDRVVATRIEYADPNERVIVAGVPFPGRVSPAIGGVCVDGISGMWVGRPMQVLGHWDGVHGHVISEEVRASRWVSDADTERIARLEAERDRRSAQGSETSLASVSAGPRATASDAEQGLHWIYGSITGRDDESIEVEGRSLHVDGDLEVEREGRDPLAARDLREGHTVLVEARGDGATLQAESIALWPILVGPVTQSSGAGLQVMNEAVHVDSSVPVSVWGPLFSGRRVAVYGTRAADGRVVATRIDSAGWGSPAIASGVPTPGPGGPVIGGTRVDGISGRMLGNDPVRVVGNWSGNRLIARSVDPLPGFTSAPFLVAANSIPGAGGAGASPPPPVSAAPAAGSAAPAPVSAGSGGGASGGGIPWIPLRATGNVSGSPLDLVDEAAQNVVAFLGLGGGAGSPGSGGGGPGDGGGGMPGGGDGMPGGGGGMPGGGDGMPGGGDGMPGGGGGMSGGGHGHDHAHKHGHDRDRDRFGHLREKRGQRGHGKHIKMKHRGRHGSDHARKHRSGGDHDFAGKHSGKHRAGDPHSVAGKDHGGPDPQRLKHHSAAKTKHNVKHRGAPKTGVKIKGPPKRRAKIKHHSKPRRFKKHRGRKRD